MRGCGFLCQSENGFDDRFELAGNRHFTRVIYPDAFVCRPPHQRDAEEAIHSRRRPGEPHPTSRRINLDDRQTFTLRKSADRFDVRRICRSNGMSDATGRISRQQPLSFFFEALALRFSVSQHELEIDNLGRRERIAPQRQFGHFDYATAAPANDSKSFFASGVPSPVQASHPGPAFCVPLLPLVTSLNPLANWPYSAGFQNPTGFPIC